MISMVSEERRWQKLGYENEGSDLKVSDDFHFQEDGRVILFPVPHTKVQLDISYKVKQT